ncbi:MAG: hypothetical protein HC817_05560 [Saprospiraceae bacterium]|nr:hypothetical protein [Saprospiraceae bacterium]
MYHVFIHVGARYTWASLRTNPADAPFLAAIGFRPDDFLSKKFSPDEIVNIEKKLLDEAENRGFPLQKLV